MFNYWNSVVIRAYEMNRLLAVKLESYVENQTPCVYWSGI